MHQIFCFFKSRDLRSMWWCVSLLVTLSFPSIEASQWGEVPRASVFVISVAVGQNPGGTATQLMVEIYLLVSSTSFGLVNEPLVNNWKWTCVTCGLSDRSQLLEESILISSLLYSQQCDTVWCSVCVSQLPLQSHVVPKGRCRVFLKAERISVDS